MKVLNWIVLYFHSFFFQCVFTIHAFEKTGFLKLIQCLNRCVSLGSFLICLIVLFFPLNIMIAAPTKMQAMWPWSTFFYYTSLPTQRVRYFGWSHLFVNGPHAYLLPVMSIIWNSSPVKQGIPPLQPIQSQKRSPFIFPAQESPFHPVHHVSLPPRY